ncbi:MAG: hypothetical protein J6M07_00140 [Ruminococcus sp.]|nr:hypothetical protein [Ruminococcus sp.]
MILPLTMPKFGIDILPNFHIQLDMPTKSDYFLMSVNSDKVSTAKYIIGKYGNGAEIPFTPMTAAQFLIDFVKALDDLREQNMDVMKLPEREDFRAHERVKLPCLTSGERLVYEHSGIDFERQSELLITEYWILLADAMKVRILAQPEGTGYLNECYMSMHRINTLTATVTD